MEPIPVPEAAKAARPYCQLVNMGPPRGVSDGDCGTAQMLIAPMRAPTDSSIPGYAGRAQYAYYRPTGAELEHLRNGGFIEVAQYGLTVQPFSAVVWPVPASGEPALDAARVEAAARAMAEEAQ